MKQIITALAICGLCTGALRAAPSEAVPRFKFSPRLSYTTVEDSAEILVVNPLRSQINQITVLTSGRQLQSSLRASGDNLSRVSIPSSALSDGKNSVQIKLSYPGGDTTATVVMEKLAPKANQVRIDNLTGVVYSADMPMIPSGFYCYSPIQKGLLEEEIVRGMNLYSPYQKVEGKTLPERLWYMDRCAELGFKVNYNLLSIAGGGGVGGAKSKNMSQDEKWKLLDQEIKAIKDHPALLSWYIADEPDGQGVEPETLEAIYDRIKSIDPYHPITVVIMSAGPGRRFANSCDIIMCDSYPVPNSPADEVVDAVQGLRNELRYEKAIWYVPQTFGGGEWWPREPTAAEIRMMTWGSVLAGARGFQAFIRHGLNGFPKNQYMWEVYTKACREIQEITPFLTDGIESKPELWSSPNSRIDAVQYDLDGRQVVVVVNRHNTPAEFKVAVDNSSSEVYALFDNYQVPLFGNTFSSMLEPFAVKVFLLTADKAEIAALKGERKLSNISNMQSDPSFEWGYSVSSHQPAGIYASTGSDRGATYALDTRTSYHGTHSLRLTTPTAGGGAGVGLFPLPLQVGKSYIMSIWAKADAESLRKNPKGMKFSMNLGGFHSQEFTLTDKWTRYEMSATYQTSVSDPRSLGSSLRLLGQGTAWFDLVEIIPDMDFTISRIGESRQFSVVMNNNIEGGVIHYTLDGSEPTISSPIYTQPLTISSVTQVKARVFKGDTGYGLSSQQVASHKAVGAKVTYAKPYNKYTGGGDQALTDGRVAQLRYTSPEWQGFIGNDMEVVIDLGTVCDINRLTSQYFHSAGDWIMPPRSVEYLLSDDATAFESLGVIELGEAKNVPAHKLPVVKDNIGKKARYIKVIAVGSGRMPSWHSKDAAWLFADEVIVE